MMAETSIHAELPDIQSMWDYGDPIASEGRFSETLQRVDPSSNPDYHAELQTQIARTYGLRRDFDAAHALLDAVEVSLSGNTPRAHVRYLLERGRTFNSSGDRNQARMLFVEAWDQAREQSLDGLAVDAAHMIALVEFPDEALQWNHAALSKAESSDDPDARRWKGSLCNNIGWTYHEKGEYETALAYFGRALTHRLEQGNEKNIRIARWCIARCLRSLNRVDEALTMQRKLEAYYESSGEASDGYVYEEIAECLLVLDRQDEARPYFRKAYDVLSKDAWLMDSEPQRVERLRKLSTAPSG